MKTIDDLLDISIWFERCVVGEWCDNTPECCIMHDIAETMIMRGEY